MSHLEHKLLGHVSRACKDFSLIEPEDRVMVAVSGGKDSYAMLALLRKLQLRRPFPFEIIAVNLDQGHPGFPGHLLEGWLREHDYTYKMLQKDTYSIVLDKIPAGKTYCSLCSRLRRGILYSAAVEMGCTKIALGHHKDDVIETLMLNLFYSGQLKAMPPKLQSDDGRNTVIRPMIYCNEVDLAAYAEEQAFPILPCDLCGSQENLQRKRIKRLLGELNDENDKVKNNIFAALSNVRPSHLMDVALREAVGLDGVTATGDVEEMLAAIG